MEIIIYQQTKPRLKGLAQGRLRLVVKPTWWGWAISWSSLSGWKSKWSEQVVLTVFTCIVELLHNKCNKCSPSGETALLHISTLSINMSVVNGIERHQVMPITCWWHEGSNLINAHLPVHCWALNVSPSFSHLCHFFPLGSCSFTLQYMYIKIYFPGFSLIINVHVCLQETVCLSVDLLHVYQYTQLCHW